MPWLSCFQYFYPCKTVAFSVSRGEDIELGVNVSSRQPANAPINIINMTTGIPTGAPQTDQSLRPCLVRTGVTDQETLQQQGALLMKR
uniref:Uncharacterized protein n=1 Tax=Daphnia galeata TaxID=27404 RepID=A0A8J2WUF9_9CRUS|nr:unnamed protein product [Daphnia galeata]